MGILFGEATRGETAKP